MGSQSENGLPGNSSEFDVWGSDLLSYYKAIPLFNGVDAESQLGELVSIFRRPLPVTVRVESHHLWRRSTEKLLAAKVWVQRNEFSSCGMSVLEVTDEQYSDIPGLREWTERENKRGTLNFQELVSTIPPLLLDPQAHHRCLDVCAAPWSKSLQLID